jgi:Family of unknown function (DUF6496)
MPDEETTERAREDAREGKAPTTQAGEFVREEIHHVREGKHGARSPQQAIAIGLSKARRAGIKVPRAPRGTASAKKQSTGKAKTRRRRPSRRRSRATSRALRREGRAAGTKRSLSRQAHRAATRRSASSRSKAARKAATTRKRTRSRARAR